MSRENSSDLAATDLLAAHGIWVRRLARALTRGDDAEDVAQETWETVLRRPPRREGGSLRAWLGRVVASRSFNQARERRRREDREDKVAREEVLAASEPTPEEISDRLRLQRQLAALVSALEEPRRRVIYLRYYEGLEPTEIARRLGVPAGTVRSRIKTTLDQLRVRLDEEHGGQRQRWRAVLLPVADAGGTWSEALPGASGTRMGWAATRMAALLAALGAALVGVVAWRGAGHRGTGVRPQAAELPLRDRPSRPPQFRWIAPSPPTGAPGIAATLAADCDSAAELAQLVAVRRRELASRGSLADMFERSAPNPVALKVFGSMFDQAIAAVGKCLHHLECRGLICRAQVLSPVEISSCFDRARAIEFEKRLYWRRSSSGGNDTPIFDPVSEQSYTRRDYYYHLARPDAAVVPREDQPAPSPLAPGLLAIRRLPATLPASCREPAERLLQELRVLELRLAQGAPAEDRFSSGVPRPELLPDVERELTRILGLEGRPLPFRLECRANVCTLLPGQSLDRSLVNPWNCRPAEAGRPEICVASVEGDGWFARLDRNVHRSAVLEGIRAPMRQGGQGGPAYLLVRPIESRHRTDPREVSCRLYTRIGTAATFEDCERKFGGQGKIALKVTLPGPDEPVPTSGRRPTLDYNGTAAGTALGRCVIDRLRGLVDEFEVPDMWNGIVLHRTVKFPGAARDWAARSPCPRP